MYFMSYESLLCISFCWNKKIIADLKLFYFFYTIKQGLNILDTVEYKTRINIYLLIIYALYRTNTIYIYYYSCIYFTIICI